MPPADDPTRTGPGDPPTRTHPPADHPPAAALRGFALGELDETAAADVAAHLASCPTCTAELDGVTKDALADKVQAVADRLPADPAPGVTVGRYRLVRLLGEGGMGSVWAADQLEPVRRTVAVKLVKPGSGSAGVLARFEAERQALAVMDHPGVAKVFDAGDAGGRPYFVMELVAGEPLTAYCDRRRLPIPARLALFARVCDAVQHAHLKGVIHRDLKPSNILVAEADGAAVPKVIDFGLAKAVGDRLTDATLTHAGAVLGTPLYMAPEQAAGGPDVDTRADVYALGAVLYELLTGSTPIDRKQATAVALHELMRLVQEEDALPPSVRAASDGVAAARAAADGRRLAATVRGELDWVTLRALEKDRCRRYQAVADLAADVRRYMDDEAVSAVPPSTWYRVRKFVRRNRAAALAAGSLLTAVSAGLGGTTYGLLVAREQARRADREADKAIDQAERADAERRSADRAYVRGLLRPIRSETEPVGPDELAALDEIRHLRNVDTRCQIVRELIDDPRCRVKVRARAELLAAALGGFDLSTATKVRAVLTDLLHEPSDEGRHEMCAWLLAFLPASPADVPAAHALVAYGGKDGDRELLSKIDRVRSKLAGRLPPHAAASLPGIDARRMSKAEATLTIAALQLFGSYVPGRIAPGNAVWLVASALRSVIRYIPRHTNTNALMDIAEIVWSLTERLADDELLRLERRVGLLPNIRSIALTEYGRRFPRPSPVQALAGGVALDRRPFPDYWAFLAWAEANRPDLIAVQKAELERLRAADR